MIKSKSKIKLAQNLRVGVAGPTSQSALYKYGGVFFLLMSLLLIRNIYATLRGSGEAGSKIATSANMQQQVLGAYDQSGSDQTATYQVQKGDTLFTIAIAQNVPWDLLATLNNLKAPYTLKTGETLKIPLVK